jgi:anti-anti-sigma regulatory factor
MTLDDVSNRLELDDDTIRWLVRLLYEEGTDLSRIGDRPLPRGTPVYTEATADVIEIQRAMARNHVRTLFVIQAQDALATVNIVNLALLIEALVEASEVSKVSESMHQELADATSSVPVVDNGSGVTVCDYGYGFTIKCSGRLGVIVAEELRSSVEHCVDRKPAFVQIDVSNIAFLEEPGMDALLFAARRCGDAGIAYQLSINSQGKRILHFAGPS